MNEVEELSLSSLFSISWHVLRIFLVFELDLILNRLMMWDAIVISENRRIPAPFRP